MELLIKTILCYLLGSISGSILVGKLNRVDIREVGSGNAGSTNAFRAMGIGLAIVVLFIDVLKGFLSVKFVPLLKLGGILTKNTQEIELLLLLCGLGVVIGHVYPIYHGFKGGKGAGTMVGVLGALFPMYLIIGLPLWLVVLIFSGYVGLSTMIAGIALPICTYSFYPNGINSPFGFFSVMVSVFIIYTHRDNIHRMLNGTENRFEKIMLLRKKTDN